MDFRDFDRKFWLVVEKSDKKITDIIPEAKNNSILCYSYYSPYKEEGLVYEAVCESVYVNGDYSITDQYLLESKNKDLTKRQLDGYQIIAISNKAINIVFKKYTELVEIVHYSKHKDLVDTREIRFIDEFRLEDNPDVIRGLLSDGKKAENIWMKLIKLLNVVDNKKYIFSCEIFSEPFVIKGIHKGEKTFAVALEENSQKVCGCSIGLEEVEKMRKSFNLK